MQPAGRCFVVVSCTGRAGAENLADHANPDRTDRLLSRAYSQKAIIAEFEAEIRRGI
jgi:hypothetical protein